MHTKKGNRTRTSFMGAKILEMGQISQPREQVVNLIESVKRREGRTL
jgi:hypothetical protein